MHYVGNFFRYFFLTIVFVVQSVAVAETPEPATITAQNEMWARWEKIVHESENLVGSLTRSQRKRLLRSVADNPVAKLSALSIYDPPQNDRPKGEIGYCYGRALAAHLTARKMGLEETSMRKIFAAGDMQNGEVRWRNHMATLVVGDDGLEYAIDPIMPGIISRYNQVHGTDYDPWDPVQPDFWTLLVKENYDNTEKILQQYPGLETNPKFTGTIKFYVASTQAMLVDMREVPASLDMENGERIIEVLFDPAAKSGFAPHYFTDADEMAGKVGLWLVETEEAEQRYFMVKNEPLVEQFSFFNIGVDIFYVKDDVMKKLPLFYLYNGKLPGETEFQHYSQGYFPSLMTAVESITQNFLDEE